MLIEGIVKDIQDPRNSKNQWFSDFKHGIPIHETPRYFFVVLTQTIW